jgi:hypothetical protein
MQQASMSRNAVTINTNADADAIHTEDAKCQCRYNINQTMPMPMPATKPTINTNAAINTRQYQCQCQYKPTQQYQCQCRRYQTDNTDIAHERYFDSNIARLLFANVGSILMRCRFCREHAASSPKGKLCCGGCGWTTITFLNTNSFEKSIWTPSTPSTGGRECAGYAHRSEKYCWTTPDATSVL